MKSLVRTAALVAVAAALAVGFGAASASADTTITVCPTAGDCDYTSIQTAIDDANSGDKITVAAGTYQEQLTIGQDLTIVGADAGSTTVEAPSGLPADGAIIDISGGNVDVSGLTIEGPGPSSCGSIMSGVFVEQGANANLHDLSVKDIADNPLSGCQNGRAILVGWGHGGSTPSNTTGEATISNVTISGYQKAGIEVSGSGSDATIENSAITGAGDTGTIAQNGIEITYGATATIDGNTVTGNSYTGADSAAGILLYQAGTVSVGQTDANSVSGNQIGLWTDSNALGQINFSGISGNDDDAVADTSGWTGTPATTLASSTAHGVGDVFTEGGNQYVEGYSAFSSIQDAVDAVDAGGTVHLEGSFTLTAPVSVGKSLTIDGGGNATVSADGSSSAFSVTAPNTKIENVAFTAGSGVTNNGFVQLLPGANDATVKDDTFTGQFDIGESQVTRGLVVSPGVTGLTVSGNTFSHVRQPAYLDNGDTGTVSDNSAKDTKGWVVGAGSSLTFTGNTWGTDADRNAVDIAIIKDGAATEDAHYTDIDALSAANNGAVIDDQFQQELSVVYVDGSKTAPGNGYWSSPFTSIQAGVDYAAPGATVNIAAGTYTEQVKIAADVNLVGAGEGTTTIKSPASLDPLSIHSAVNKPVVSVDGAKVGISDLTIDGDGQGNANYRFDGIGASNADLTVDHVAVEHVRNTPFDGSQHGVGIYEYNTAGTHTASLSNVTVSDYQKGGIVLSGSGLTADVTDSVVTGATKTDETAQNGIQVSYGATGTLTGNTVSGNFCTVANVGDDCTADPAAGDPNADGAAGILLYRAGAVEVADNRVKNNQFGIWSVGSTALDIHDNRVASSDATSTGIAVWNADQWMSAGDAKGTSGAIEDNTLSGTQYGLLVTDYGSSGSHLPTIAAHGNGIVGTTTPAWSNTSFDATKNWFGTASGPGALPHVNTTPWCTTSDCSTFSNDADLTALSLSAGTLDPAFDAATTSYTAGVDHGTNSISVNAAATPGATVAVTGDGHLSVGDNRVQAAVTSADGTATKTYTVMVDRGADQGNGNGNGGGNGNGNNGNGNNGNGGGGNGGGGNDGGGGGGGGGAVTTAGVPTHVASLLNQPQSVPGQPGKAGQVTVQVGNVNTPPPTTVTLSWAAGTFDSAVTVQLTPKPGNTSAAGLPAPVVGGFAVGGTVVQVTVTGADGKPVTVFDPPLVIHLSSAQAGEVPGYSEDGKSWTSIPRLHSPTLPAGQPDGYYVNEDGSVDIYTRHATLYGLLTDTQAPARPVLHVRLTGTKLRLVIHAKDNVRLAHYLVLRNGKVIKRTGHAYLVLKARKARFQIAAVDKAGNRSKLSKPVILQQTKSRKHPFKLAG